MNNRRGVALIRRRRDYSLDVLRWFVWTIYFVASFAYLSVKEMEGLDVLGAACIVYTSYALGALLYAMESLDYKLGLKIKSIRSYTALVITLIIAFPIRVMLFGITGYWEYAQRECKRISILEVSRWKERP